MELARVPFSTTELATAPFRPVADHPPKNKASGMRQLPGTTHPVILADVGTEEHKFETANGRESTRITQSTFSSGHVRFRDKGPAIYMASAHSTPFGPGFSQGERGDVSPLIAILHFAVRQPHADLSSDER